MKSAKLAFIGCCVAGALIISNIFMLRYFTATIKSGLNPPAKSKIISNFVPHSAGPVYGEYGILDDHVLDAESEGPINVTPKNSKKEQEGLKNHFDETMAENKYPEAVDIFLARPVIKPLTTQKPGTTTPKEHPDLEKLIKEVSAPATEKCQLKVKFGRDENKDFGHETWRLCFDDPYKIKLPCLVYSFGIAYDFSFDDDLAKFGCKVFSFDPSMDMPDHRRDSGVMFFNIGIAQYDSFHYKPEINAFNNKTTWVVKSLRTIRRDLKHTNTMLDVLKLDVEGMEWVAVEQAIADGILEKTRFFLIEWHVCPRDLTDKAKIDAARSVYRQLLDLGFVKYFNDPWITNPFNNCRMVLNYFVRPASF